MSKETNFTQEEARRRIDELKAPFELAHQYARIERATLMPDGKPETDGEHGISLGVIAMAYAMKYRPELDPYKVFFYGVLHDIDEFLHGDTPTVSASPETFATKAREEAEAAVERKKILDAFPEFNALIDELEDVRVPEHAFGKAFDKLAPGYTHAQNLGRVLRERYAVHSYEDLLESVRATDEKMLTYASDFGDVLAMRQAMHRKVGDTAFKGVWVDVPLFDL